MTIVSRPHNSTTDRIFMPPVPPRLKALRLSLRVLDRVAPRLATRAVVRLWFSVGAPRASRRAQPRAEASPLALDVRGVRVRGLTWGTGAPVLLLHGWGGRLEQLFSFVDPLVAAGHRVIAIDVAGHGRSDASHAGWRLATLFDFADAVAAVAEREGPLHAIVAHSGGGMASGIALDRGLTVRKLVLLAPMVDVTELAAGFGSMLGTSATLQTRWMQQAAARVGFEWPALHLAELLSHQPRPDVLLVHDEGDAEVPVHQSRTLASALDVELVTTRGLGHRKLLSDAAMVERVARFVATP